MLNQSINHTVKIEDTVVKALAFGPRGPGFAFRPCHHSKG